MISDIFASFTNYSTILQQSLGKMILNPMGGMTYSILFWHVLGKEVGDNIQSTIHAILVSIMGLVGMYTGDYEVLNRIIRVFTSGYFIADFTNNLKKDMVFHHLSTMFVMDQLIRRYPLTSVICRGILIEGSTPFLNEYKRTKKKRWGVGLLVSFVLLRVLWLPWLYYDFITNEDPELHPGLQALVVVFLALNWFWHYKITRIAWKVANGETKKRA